MPPLKRSSKRAGDLHPLAVDAEELFRWGDGTWCMFTGVAEPYDNVLLARAAWRAARVATWDLPDRGLWPPGGAVHDGITSRTERCRPLTMGARWSAAAVAEAAAVDTASVAAFRAADRAGARSIHEHLELYVADLATLAELSARAEERADAGPGTGDEETGPAKTAGAAWAALEARRRG